MFLRKLLFYLKDHFNS